MATEFELRQQVKSLYAIIGRMETQHVVFYGPGGEEFHPDWCRECRVSVLLALLWQVMTVRRGPESPPVVGSELTMYDIRRGYDC